MVVFVDELRNVFKRAGFCSGRVGRACYLMADTAGELEQFRRKLGLRQSWRHGDHYDLSPGKRAKAVWIGAVEVSGIVLVALRRRRRVQ